MDLAYQIEKWFYSNNWEIFPFQKKCWEGIYNRQNGLLCASTGSGKTYAIWMGFLNRWILEENLREKFGVKLLWITPLRALGGEIVRAMQKPVLDLNLSLQIILRTGDSSVQIKDSIMKNPPDVLITTPESLHLILARYGYRKILENIELIVLDEWHELQGSKRGVMMELALSWMREFNAYYRIWGISATLANADEAAEVLLGKHTSVLIKVKGPTKKKINIHAIYPDDITDLPQSGHIGIKLLEKTLPIIFKPGTTLIFTNTRSQAEIWYQRFLEICPELAGRLALHHGSIEGEIRHWVEDNLKNGKLKAVVCTSSLDLGVDFLPVERVIQVGSPKSVARFVQRAGRSGHSPGRKSEIWFVPTHSMELVEAAALRVALENKILESRPALTGCYDVLMQFMSTLALSEGFKIDELFQVVKNTHCFKHLEYKEFLELHQFTAMGGKALNAYPDFNRFKEEDGVFRIADKKLALRHRLNVGVIPSDAMMHVKLKNGKRLGMVEEWFISRLSRGDTFFFAGQPLELIQIKDMEVIVSPSKEQYGTIPSWMGGRLPLSSPLAHQILDIFSKAREGDLAQPELKVLKPLLDLQLEISEIPRPGFKLIEQFKTRLGYHTLLYPMEGRIAHETIGAILAYRLGKMMSVSLSLAMNDYGLEILSDKPLPATNLLDSGLFSTENLYQDMLQSINAVELAQRRFRDIARIAGLIFTGYPGREKKSRHLQASASLLFDVLSDHDSGNLLLRQAFSEAIHQGVEEERVFHFFHYLSNEPVKICHLEMPSPISIPIITDRLRNSFSSKSIEDEIANILSIEIQ